MTTPLDSQVWANQMLETIREEFPEGCTVQKLVDWLGLMEEDVLELAEVLLRRGALMLKPDAKEQKT